jgi:hypothetical protein
VLKEQESRFAGANWKILLNFLALAAAEGWVGKHHVITIFFLDVGEVFGQRIGVDNIRRFDAVKDHVHDRDDVSERLFSLP